MVKSPHYYYDVLKITKSEQAEPKAVMDIHDFDSRINGALKCIQEQLSPKTVDLITKYYYDMISSKSLAQATQEKHLRALLTLSKMLGKEWTKTDAEDIKKLVVDFMRKNKQNVVKTESNFLNLFNF